MPRAGTPVAEADARDAPGFRFITDEEMLTAPEKAQAGLHAGRSRSMSARVPHAQAASTIR